MIWRRNTGAGAEPSRESPDRTRQADARGSERCPRQGVGDIHLQTGDQDGQEMLELLRRLSAVARAWADENGRENVPTFVVLDEAHTLAKALGTVNDLI